MKIYFIKFKALALAFILMIMAGCERNFLDINVDPNNPTEVPLSQLLPYAQLNMTNSFGFGTAGLTSVLAVYVHQTTRRANIDDYGITGDFFGLTQPWINLYAGALTDLEVNIEQGTEQEDWAYVGVAQILKAYSFSLMVDVWGDIPYTEALSGAEIRYPIFDRGQDIYADLFVLLNEGIANLAKPSNLVPRGDDLFYGGNLDRWRRLGKTIKLKMYNQVRLVPELYNAGEVATLINENDLLTGLADDFEMQYGTSVSPDSRNPAFTSEWPRGQRTYYISPYFYEILTAQSSNPVLEGIPDPRVPYYFFNQLTDVGNAENPTEYTDPATGFLSIYFGSISPNRDFGQGDSQTIIGLYPAGGRYDDGRGGIGAVTSNAGEVNGPGDVPQRLLTHFDRLFIQAELALMAGAPGDPRQLFESGVRGAMAKVNQVAANAGAPVITAERIDTYVESVMELFDARGQAGQLELILTQKWISSFGFSVDAYTDYRRTGYPVMFDPGTDGNPLTQRTRNYPVSFPYYTNDLQINPNAPPQRVVSLDRVFWDR
ncbi:SusD/RagB family nutrient-binding outer membrane lipoprotein [soil metagenome]